MVGNLCAGTVGRVIYRMKAARPAAAAMPAKTVGWAAPPVEDEVEVALARADVKCEEREDAALEALEAIDETFEDAAEASDEALEDAPEAADEA